MSLPPCLSFHAQHVLSYSSRATQPVPKHTEQAWPSLQTPGRSQGALGQELLVRSSQGSTFHTKLLAWCTQSSLCTNPRLGVRTCCSRGSRNPTTSKTSGTQRPALDACSAARAQATAANDITAAVCLQATAPLEQ